MYLSRYSNVEIDESSERSEGYLQFFYQLYAKRVTPTGHARLNGVPARMYPTMSESISVFSASARYESI